MKIEIPDGKKGYVFFDEHEISIVLSKSLTIEEIIQIVSTQMDIPPSTICGLSRHQEIVAARYVIARLAREQGYTLQSIGRVLHRNHTTVLHYIRNIKYFPRAYQEYVLARKTINPPQHEKL